MSLHHNPRVVTSGLVLALDAGDVNSYPGSGTTWYDLTGGSSATLSNGPAFSTDGVGSLYFDGTNDGVTKSFTPTADAPITVATWVNIATINYGHIVSQLNDSVAWDGFAIYINNDSRFRAAFLKTYGSVQAFLTSTFTFTVGEWCNVVLMYTGTAAQLYINGTLDTNTSYTGGYDPASFNLGIGMRGSTGEYTSGNIASVHIYNRALSATEIEQNYLAQKSRFGL